MINALKFLQTITALILIFLLASCEKETFNEFSNTSGDNREVHRDGEIIVAEKVASDQAFKSAIGPGSCVAQEISLMAGQHTNAGMVKITNDYHNIYVTFSTKDGWVLGQTHLYAGTMDDMPTTKKGNPKVGNFPYKATHDPMVNSYTYTIPFRDFKMYCFILAAHAEVHKIGDDGQIEQSETAWGDGIPFTQKGSWATYFKYCICFEV